MRSFNQNDIFGNLIIVGLDLDIKLWDYFQAKQKLLHPASLVPKGLVYPLWNNYR